jgi:glycosyltransferase involved in cell wall biosynthesis
MMQRKVTVICLCYNQERFVKEAILSVLNQTYQPVQLLVVDDASTDNSARAIKEMVALHPEIVFLQLGRNLGNCKAFNYALKYAEGDYLIDLAADDVLLPERVSKGVAALNEAGSEYGVNFSDAYWMREDGSLKYRHSERFPHATVPQGNIYQELIERFFICSPTVLFRRAVIEALNGYDESLAYEDFDFWIRSSRIFLYCYTPEVLVKKRVVRNSMSQKQFSLFSSQLRSTFRVCEKIMALNKSADEQRALGRRILYEMKVALRLLHLPLLVKYALLYFRNATLRY